MDAHPVPLGPFNPLLYRVHAFHLPGGILRVWSSAYGTFHRAEPAIAPPTRPGVPDWEVVSLPGYVPEQDRLGRDPPQPEDATYASYLEYDSRHARNFRYAAMGIVLRDAAPEGLVLPLWHTRNNAPTPYIDLRSPSDGPDVQLGDFCVFDYTLAAEYLFPLARGRTDDERRLNAVAAFNPLPRMGTRITQLGASRWDSDDPYDDDHIPSFTIAPQPHLIPDITLHRNVRYDAPSGRHVIAWHFFSFHEQEAGVEPPLGIMPMFHPDDHHFCSSTPRPRHDGVSVEVVYGPVPPPGSMTIAMCSPFCPPVCVVCESRYFNPHVARLALMIKNSWHDHSDGHLLRPYSPFKCHGRVEVAPGVFSAQCARPLTNAQLHGRFSPNGTFSHAPTLFCDACASYYHRDAFGDDVWLHPEYDYELADYYERGRPSFRQIMRDEDPGGAQGVGVDCDCRSCTWLGPPCDLPPRASNKHYTAHFVE